MLDERIGMVRAAGQQNGKPVVAAAGCQYVDGLLMDGRYVGALFGHGGVEGFVARLAVYAIAAEEGVDLLLQQLLIAEVDDGRHDLVAQIHR